MKKYKICVYAICKNEEKYVDRWYESMKEADEIYVLDTGSTDNTVEKLKKHNINVEKKEINPWRFDTARNEALKMVPEDCDICVCTDLDEIFVKGWREKLENKWQDNTTRAEYSYNWSLDKNNNPLISFYIEKIHARKGYEWVYPVHEVLKRIGIVEYVVRIEDMVLNHYPDTTKSRSSYLPLLELSIKENPNDDRNMHYLGREYMYYRKWNKAIDTLIKHLNLKSATWKDERCASMRFIARSYINLKRYDEAKMWLEKAIKEAPYLRDAYVEMALLNYQLNEWENVKNNCLKALEIKFNPKTYINEPYSFDYTIYDLLSLYYFETKDYNASLNYVELALKLNSDDERLNKNKEIIEKFVSLK